VRWRKAGVKVINEGTIQIMEALPNIWTQIINSPEQQSPRVNGVL
jgi:hypothetical protein